LVEAGMSFYGLYLVVDFAMNYFYSGEMNRGVLNFYLFSVSGRKDLIMSFILLIGFVISSRFVREVIKGCKQTEEEQKKYADKIEKFAYSVCHDLKSPVVGLYGLVRRLHDKHSETLDEKGKIYCDQIMRAAEHIEALVRNINEFITTREVPMNLQKLNIREVIELVREEFIVHSNAARKVEWHIPEKIPEMRADRTSIHRVLRNLMDNALKYGGEGLSRIIIECEERQDSYFFSFHDDGKGIHEDDQIKVFELFQRLKSSKEVDGSGMGLAIVKEIVERHGGRIWVESVPEKGTTFFFSISKKIT
jgi:signal transduction histidine kinase